MIEDRQPGSVALGLPRLIPGIVFESPDVISRCRDRGGARAHPRYEVTRLLRGGSRADFDEIESFTLARS